MAEKPSLEYLYKDIPPEKLDQPCRDDHLIAPLNMAQYQAVRKALLKVRPQWRNIGLELGIPLHKLNEFSGSFEKRMDKMIKAWLNQTLPTPTWEALVKALRDDTVEGGKPVAAEIEENMYRGGEQSVVVRPSLKDLLEGVPPEKLDQPCRDDHLNKIALSLTDWQSIAPFLGLTEADEEEIKQGYPNNIKTQKIAMLRKWKKSRGRKAKYRKLASVFWDLERTDLVEKVCELLQTESSSSSSEEDGPLATKRSRTSLDSYAEYLKGRYRKERPMFFTLQWPPPPTRKVFNLAMIHHETIQHGPVDEDLVRQTQRGNVDDIMRWKTPVKLENMFNFDREEREVILIEGAPGAGKSTLAWHICQKWKSGELFQEFKVVVFVQLRDPAIQSAKSLADILPARSSNMRTELQSIMEACDGGGVLFVLDGWDEYGPELQHNSLFWKLICKPEDLSIHCSSVVITSRPVASGALQQYASSRVEIVGFTPAEMKCYFTKVLSGNPQTVRELEEQLEERPVIQASCYLPLNATIVVHLFLVRNHTLPHTLHEVFQSLVICCVIRHLKKEDREVDISSLDDLPPDIREPFLKICKLAFHAVDENKATFSEADLQSLELPPQLSPLSLIQAVECFRSFKKSKSYNFMHLSIQELLAAFHISKMEASEQVRIFNTLFKNPRYEAVFRFYAGFTKLETPGIREVVARMATGGEKSLLHCLYEAQDVALCGFVASRWFKTFDLGRMISSPLDCVVVGYYLSCVCCNTTEELTLDLRRYEFDDYKKRLLVRELSKCSEKEVRAEVPGCLQVNADSNPHMYMGKIAGRKNPHIGEIVNCSPIVKKLRLCGADLKIDEEGLCQILTDLARNSSLVELELGNVNTMIHTQECGHSLNQMLQMNKSLKELHFYGGVSDCVISSIGEGLTHNTSIDSLKLCCSSMGMKHLAKALSNNNHLRSINLRGNTFDDHGIVHISNSLRVNCGLKRLDISGLGCVIKEQGARALSQALEVNTSLESLTVTISDEAEVSCIFEALCKNHTLQSLSVTCLAEFHRPCRIENYKKLSHALIVNTSLKELQLVNQIIDRTPSGSSAVGRCTDDSLMVLGSGLKQNKGLTTLKLHSAVEGRQGLQPFLLCLVENDHLTELYIYGYTTSNLEELQMVNERRQQKGLPLLQLVHF